MASAESGPQPAIRLLVVDDEPGVRETLAAVLRHEGYEVRAAGRLDEAMEWLRTTPFDVVLTDLRLAEGDAADPLEELRALAPDALVIVLTGYATLDSALRALRAGAFAYLTKPTDVEELRVTVRRGLERLHLQRELARRVAELEAANASIRDFNAELQRQVAAATAALRQKVAALDASNRQLRLAQGQHDRFVAMVAHELRGPLLLVMNYAQLAARPRLTPEQQADYTGAIIQAAQRLNRLVEDLQTATRLSAGQFDIQRAPCDLVEAVCTEVEQFATMVPDRRFDCAGPPDLAPASIDRDRVLQALRNLLDNAVKYSRRDGAISVRVRADAARAYVDVRDEGAGISEAELARLGQPFTRGTSSTEVPGSGLGLYITRGIVEAHGGELLVHNGDGPARARGAVFTLALPLDAGAIDARDAAP